MKHLILTTLFSLLLSVVYGQDNKPVEKEAENLDKATIRCFYQFTQKFDNRLRTDTLALDIGPKMSRYYDFSRSKRDSILKAFTDKYLVPSNIQSISVIKEKENEDLDFSQYTGNQATTNAPGEMKYQVFKNCRTGEINLIDYPSGVFSQFHYQCTDKIGSLPWQVSPESATVLNYTCQKANLEFRGRRYIAWFAPEIASNDGPWKFFGLPGLILKVTDSEGLFSFECVGIEHLPQAVDITVPKAKYINCSRKEFNKMKSKEGETLINANGGNIVIVGKKQRASLPEMELDSESKE